MLRDAHTLKGSSRMVGLIEISDIAHRLEDIMVKVRDGEMAYTPEMSDHFFEALDAIVYLADNAGKDVEIEIDLEALQAHAHRRWPRAAADGASQAQRTQSAEHEAAPSRRMPTPNPDATAIRRGIRRR